MSRAAASLAIFEGQREVLETLAKLQGSPRRVVRRVRVLLLAGDGVSNSAIGEMVGISRPTVLTWREQFEKEGLAGFGEVAELTLHSKPDGETHWSCRSMAKRVGVSPASMQMIWSTRGLKPNLVKTFKRWFRDYPKRPSAGECPQRE